VQAEEVERRGICRQKKINVSGYTQAENAESCAMRRQKKLKGSRTGQMQSGYMLKQPSSTQQPL